MADQGSVWLIGSRSKSVGADSLRPIGCTPTLSVTQKRCCSCSMRLVVLPKCYMTAFVERREELCVNLPIPLSPSTLICFVGSLEVNRHTAQKQRRPGLRQSCVCAGGQEPKNRDEQEWQLSPWSFSSPPLNLLISAARWKRRASAPGWKGAACSAPGSAQVNHITRRWLTRWRKKRIARLFEPVSRRHNV